MPPRFQFKSKRLLRKGKETSESPVRVKLEQQQDDSSNHGSDGVHSIETISVKSEPQSDSDSGHENGGMVPKKKFKRVKEIHDDSSSDSDNNVTKRKRVRRSIIDDDSDSESEEERSREQSRRASKDDNDTEEVSSDEDESKSSVASDSSSSKGVIEFESSSDDTGTEKSYTSSEDEEIDDDGLSKECLVCRNLGSATIAGRKNRYGTSSWCKCGNCRIVGFMKDYDRVCCREIKDVVVFLDDEMDDASKSNMCVTSHPRFEIDVLKHEALIRTHFYRTKFYGNDDTYNSAWSFIRWIWNKIGWGTRMVIPACVSAKIKEKNGPKFQCFNAVTTCKKNNHCAKSQI